jgi:hypothetical protein
VNFYKYIVLEIQDMATGELVHSLSGFNIYEDNFIIDNNPIQYYTDANNLTDLLAAKEIMTATLNSIYEVLAVSDDLDNEENYIMKPVSVYIDNFIYYNVKILPELSGKSTPPLHFKKLTKGRFQIIERFTNEPPKLIEVFEGDIA